MWFKTLDCTQAFARVARASLMSLVAWAGYGEPFAATVRPTSMVSSHQFNCLANEVRHEKKKLEELVDLVKQLQCTLDASLTRPTTVDSELEHSVDVLIGEVLAQAARPSIGGIRAGVELRPDAAVFVPAARSGVCSDQDCFALLGLFR